MEINPNFTIFIQAGIYLAIFFILKTLYFRPILELLKKREQLTQGRRTESGELEAQLAAIKATYDSQLKEVREKLEVERLQSIQKVRTAAEDRISQAKSKSEKAQTEHSDALDREAKSVRGKFSVLSGDIKKEIVSSMVSSRVVSL